ncbi:MAG: hypothetical protein WCY05_08140 [Candidatus Omnitrophota bacterium]
MKAKGWIGLIEKNRDEIERKIIEAYKESLVADTKTMGIETAVILYSDGDITIGTTSQNWGSMDVFNGDAIEITRFSASCVWDVPESLADCLTDDDNEGFKTWCKKNCEDVTSANLGKWNVHVFKNVYEDIVRYLVNDCDDFVKLAINNKIDELERMAFYDKKK